MKTIDLTAQPLSVDELLHFASVESVMLIAQDGHEYLVEEADEFEAEATRLGQSARFMRFLEERRQEEGAIPLDEIERKLAVSSH